jgi:hypothetical protein
MRWYYPNLWRGVMVAGLWGGLVAFATDLLLDGRSALLLRCAVYTVLVGPVVVACIRRWGSPG